MSRVESCESLTPLGDDHWCSEISWGPWQWCYVWLCVCLHEHISGTGSPIFANFFRMCHVAVAQSSSGGIAIFYVLPVLWMTSS